MLTLVLFSVSCSVVLCDVIGATAPYARDGTRAALLSFCIRHQYYHHRPLRKKKKRGISGEATREEEKRDAEDGRWKMEDAEREESRKKWPMRTVFSGISR